MSESLPLHEILEQLRQFGVVANLDDADQVVGIPVGFRLRDGGTLVFDAAEAVPFEGFDSDQIGLATLNTSGVVRSVFGLAKRVPHLAANTNALSTPLGNLILQAFEGQSGSVYHEGYRYHTAPARYGKHASVAILVTNAGDERRQQLGLTQFERVANVLTNLGMVLSMHQTVQSLCVAAAHEIASKADLAAALIWTLSPDDRHLVLTAHVGVNRVGAQTLERIDTTGGSSCIAELVAGSRHPFHHSHVSDHLMTRELEAKICYLKPGGVSVHPLVTGDRVMGVIEMIGKEADLSFATQSELFQTVADHVALAINSALMFENLERLATHDPLTGIANHRALQEFLHRRTVEAKRMNQELGLLMIDVDHFRAFNEEEGHEAGDRALQLVAQTLKDCVRPYDLAARYGGEEFTVVLPGSGIDASLASAERIRVAIEQIPLRSPSGRSRSVTISVGCAVFPYAAEDPTMLLRAADAALYESKRSGRNRVTAYAGPSGEKSKGSIDLSRLAKLLPEEDRVPAEKRLAALDSPLNSLAAMFQLPQAHIDLIRGVILLGERYMAVEEQERAFFESRGEVRPLLPSLEALGERFDGRGERGLRGARIPLVGRIATALLALASDRGHSFALDPGRFDPQIVALVSELDNAA